MLIKLEGPGTRAFRSGDVVRPHDGDSGFTVVAHADGTFVPPPRSIDDDSVVEVVSVSGRLCLEVDYRSSEMTVTGTIDASVRTS